MLKAGNITIQDDGFAVTVERLGGSSREVMVLELDGGIAGDEIAALCAGPIELAGEDGSITRTYNGPFRVVSHTMRLARTSESGDVASLTAKLASMAAELAAERNEKNSALSSLASLRQELSDLKDAIRAAGSGALGGLGGLIGGTGASGEQETA